MTRKPILLFSTAALLSCREISATTYQNYVLDLDYDKLVAKGSYTNLPLSETCKITNTNKDPCTVLKTWVFEQMQDELKYLRDKVKELEER